ncbi:MAG: hypothetical protein ACYCX5_12535 [Coriobacteriia bacterium]
MGKYVDEKMVVSLVVAALAVGAVMVMIKKLPSSVPGASLIKEVAANS